MMRRWFVVCGALLAFGAIALGLSDVPVRAQAGPSQSYLIHLVNGQGQALVGVVVHVTAHGTTTPDVCVGTTDALGFLEPACLLPVATAFDFTTNSVSLPQGQFTTPAVTNIALIAGPVGPNGSPGPAGTVGPQGLIGLAGHGATTTSTAINVPSALGSETIPVQDSTAFPTLSYLLVTDGTNSFVGQVTAHAARSLTVTATYILSGTPGTIMATGSVVTFSGPVVVVTTACPTPTPIPPTPPPPTPTPPPPTPTPPPTPSPTPSGVILQRTANATETTPQTTIVVSPGSAPVAGRLLIVSIWESFSPAISAAPAGWTLLDTQTITDLSSTQYVYYRVTGASEPATYTWTFSDTAYAVATYAEFSGYLASGPIDQHGISGPDPGFNSLSFVPTAIGDLPYGVSTTEDSGLFTGTIGSLTTGWTQQGTTANSQFPDIPMSLLEAAVTGPVTVDTVGSVGYSGVLGSSQINALVLIKRAP